MTKENLSFVIKYVALVAIISLGLAPLYGCGGGGGGGVGGGSVAGTSPSVVITNQNSTEVATEVTDSYNTLNQNIGQTTRILYSTTSEAQPNRLGVVNLIVWQVERIMGSEDEPFKNLSVVQSETIGCDYGGTMSASWNDADNNDDLSPGDTLNLTMNSCRMNVEGETGTMDGSMRMNFHNVSGDFSPNGSFRVTATMTNLVFDLPSDYGKISGDMLLEYMVSNFGNNHRIDASGSVLFYTDALGENRTLRGYLLEALSIDNMATMTFSYSGALTNAQSLGGTVTFETIEDFYGSTDDYPHEGVLVITGAIPEGGTTNSSLKVTVLDNTNVKIETDSDGNGSYDTSEVILWSQFEL